MAVEKKGKRVEGKRVERKCVERKRVEKLENHGIKLYKNNIYII